jgi:hypothetical protein
VSTSEGCCRWILQQPALSRFASGEESCPWEQHLPPEQQEPPQQQVVREEETPRQNGLCWPFGQIQSKCGTLAIRVETAVRQTNPTWTALLNHLILSFFPRRTISSTPFQSSE